MKPWISIYLENAQDNKSNKQGKEEEEEGRLEKEKSGKV